MANISNFFGSVANWKLPEPYDFKDNVVEITR